MNERKDVHFQIPKALAEEFERLYPGRGERRAVLEQFVEEAIRLQAGKDYFINLVTRHVAMRRMMELENDCG